MAILFLISNVNYEILTLIFFFYIVADQVGKFIKKDLNWEIDAVKQKLNQSAEVLQTELEELKALATNSDFRNK